MKRGFLSKTEKEYIEQNINLSIAELAKDLDRSEDAIQKYVDELDIVEPKKEQTLFDKVIAKKNGATVMNQAASEAIDTFRGRKLPPKLNGCIHKIK